MLAESLDLRMRVDRFMNSHSLLNCEDFTERDLASTSGLSSSGTIEALAYDILLRRNSSICRIRLAEKFMRTRKTEKQRFQPADEESAAVGLRGWLLRQ
jgi:hypothetical protein